MGSITVNWKMGDITIKHALWVVKGMAFEVVMGRGALRTMSAVIDCSKMTAKVGGVEINLYGHQLEKGKLGES